MIILSSGARLAGFNATGLKAAMANGIIYVYTGPQPATADAAVQGTLLMKITKDAGAFAFGTSTNGLNFDAPTVSGNNILLAKAAAENWQGVAIAAGVPGWFRHMANPTDALGVSTSLPRIDGTVGNAGSDLIIVGTSFEIGTPETVVSYQLSWAAFRST